MRKQEIKVYDLTEEHQNASSLNDEIAIFPQEEIHLKLCNKVPCFAHPYATKEDKNQL